MCVWWYPVSSPTGEGVTGEMCYICCSSVGHGCKPRFHCTVRLASTILEPFFFGFPLWLAPGTFFGVTSVEVPSELSRYWKSDIKNTDERITLHKPVIFKIAKLQSISLLSTPIFKKMAAHKTTPWSNDGGADIPLSAEERIQKVCEGLNCWPHNQRTFQQCREEFKKLKHNYRHIKDPPAIGRWIWFIWEVYKCWRAARQGLLVTCASCLSQQCYQDLVHHSMYVVCSCPSARKPCRGELPFFLHSLFSYLCWQRFQF